MRPPLVAFTPVEHSDIYSAAALNKSRRTQAVQGMLFASLQMPETRFNEITDKVGCVSVPSFMAPGTWTTGVTLPSPAQFRQRGSSTVQCSR